MRAEAFSLFRQYSVRHLFANVIRLMISIPCALLLTMRMSRRWPWDDHEAYLDWPIEELRRDFNIVVVAPSRQGRNA